MRYGIIFVSMFGVCFGSLSEEAPPPRDLSAALRAKTFAARGQTDLYVAASAAVNFPPEDERLWSPAIEMGGQLLTRSDLKGERSPEGPAVCRDISEYRRLHPEYARVAGRYTRPKENAKGVLVSAFQIAVQAETVDAVHMLSGLIISRGPVDAKTQITSSLVITNGNVTAAGTMMSVIISDGDVKLAGAMRSLIIARGNIEIDAARGCYFVAGGKVSVNKIPPAPLVPNNVDDPKVQLRFRAELAEFESTQKVDWKANESKPLGFITFFELHRVGLEAKAAEKVVTLTAVKDKSAAALAGFKVGDVVATVGDKKPADVEALRRALRDALALGDATVTVTRDGKPVTLKLALPE